MKKVWQPVFSHRTGWVLGVIENHQARPATREEIDEAVRKLEAAEEVKP